MRYGKRCLIALLSAWLTLLPACQEQTAASETDTVTAAPETTVETETEETRIYPDLPAVTYDGATFDFYYRENERDGWNLWPEILVEEITGEVINDAVYNRNILIEEQYQVKLTKTENWFSDCFAVMENIVKSGDTTYEVFVLTGHMVPFIYTKDLFMNLHTLPYVDFEKPWWDQNATESFTLKGYLPFTVSDMFIMNKGAAAVTFFNKKLAADYQVPNLYDDVEAGKWTMARLIEYGKLVETDLDGDGASTDADRYGLVSGDDPVNFFFHSVGGRYISKDEEGYPVMSFENERNYTAIMYYLDNIMYDEKLTHNNAFIPDAKLPEDMFMEDQGLFYINLLRNAIGFRDMDADFGVIPIPKYEESQSSYSSTVSVFGGSLFAVPKTNGALEMTGVLIEALSAESMYTVEPELYETVLKSKSMRDEQSSAMLDIIFDNLVYDVGEYYNIDNFPDKFLRITGHVHEYVNASYPQKTSNPTTLYEQNRAKLEKGIEELKEIIDKWS